MYETQPSIVMGFHGCDRSVGEGILSGKTDHLNHSTNDYDWLGGGIYFWESNPERAFDFASERSQGGKSSRGAIKDPFVLGAVIDLGRCLNLVDSAALQQVKDAYDILLASRDKDQLPTNGEALMARRLDCAVIETLHEFRKEQGYEPFNSVRGVFWEGDDLYTGAGFKSKNHIQICVRDQSCIKGYFRPIEHPPALKS
ncbi:MAG: hypothetical protein H6956_02650 [Chromatiaceae bacterium]|nr:hypothetical protein [Chromatiaceae bacterium]MCP5438950.1 hypothetical protein [Chromatiaceae bacterium]MCP5441270.1 hypothetical protein [Chromatiaceae bacterium]